METAPKTLLIDQNRTEVSPREKAFLVHGSQKFPIQAQCASKFSLFFRYTQDQPAGELDQSVSLLIQNNGDSVQLGPCRVLSGPNLNGDDGRLVFTDDVYDIRSLLNHRRVINLKSAFDDLPFILNRKNNIKSVFKDFTADLAYDLSVYKKLFDDLDFQYSEEPQDVKSLIQKAVIESEGQQFMQFFHKSVEALNGLVADFNPEEHQLHGFYFRKQLRKFILCCALMTRTNLKPRGYAGDSAMMKMIYSNTYQGDSTFCKLMQKYTVGVPAAQSVRNRRELIVRHLRRFREKQRRGTPNEIKVLSVACGPACELDDILKTPADFEKFHFTLLDQDKKALDEAATVISNIEQRSGASVKVDYSNISVRLMLGKKPFKSNTRKFHFIYSMGLFDYLSTPIAAAVLNKLHQLLLPEGELIVGNFHISNPSKHFMEYWGDWHLIHRDEQDMRNLLPHLSDSKLSVIFEETGSQMFLDIQNSA